MQPNRVLALWTIVVLMTGVCCLIWIGCGMRKQPAAGSQAKTPEPALHKLLQGGYDLAAILNSAEKETEDLYSTQLIDASEARTAASWIGRGKDADDQFVGRLQTLSVVDWRNKQDVIGWTNELVGSFNVVIQNGTAGIKNQTARLRLQAAFTGVQLVITAFGAALNSVPDTAPAAPAAPQSHANNFTPLKRAGQVTVSQGEIMPGARAGMHNDAHVEPRCPFLAAGFFYGGGL